LKVEFSQEDLGENSDEEVTFQRRADYRDIGPSRKWRSCPRAMSRALDEQRHLLQTAGEVQRHALSVMQASPAGQQTLP
tara:strand:+ start:976 stop:1212 length:237 start_codon:yes stop_codon:yes gene_type:complete